MEGTLDLHKLDVSETSDLLEEQGAESEVLSTNEGILGESLTSIKSGIGKVDPDGYIHEEAETAPVIDDRLIVEQVLSGDKDAYRTLVDRYKDGLVRYCYSIVLDEAAASDAAQQAFIAAYNKLHTYKPKFAFSTWLYRISRNESLKEMKRLNKQQPIECMAELPSDEDISAEYDKQIEHEKLNIALATLRHDWRQMIHFYYWEGKTYEEIAELTGKPINTVRVWLRRAKMKLEKELILIYEQEI